MFSHRFTMHVIWVCVACGTMVAGTGNISPDMDSPEFDEELERTKKFRVKAVRSELVGDTV
jgi:ribosomal protein L37AE/L43A